VKIIIESDDFKELEKPYTTCFEIIETKSTTEVISMISRRGFFQQIRESL
jgi:hypothetical protein